MGVKCRFMVVMLLLACVTTIFVSPAVNLQPTALRALKFSNVLFAVLALAATALWGCLQVPLETATTIVERHFVLAPPPELFELNCARLC